MRWVDDLPMALTSCPLGNSRGRCPLALLPGLPRQQCMESSCGAKQRPDRQQNASARRYAVPLLAASVLAGACRDAGWQLLVKDPGAGGCGSQASLALVCYR